MRVTAILGVVLAFVALPAQTAEVRVLSAAAVTPGLRAAAELYHRRSGDTVTITYATGPEIGQRIGAGEHGFDVVVAPEPALATLAAAGRVRGDPVRLGRVGISLAVRHGTPAPALESAAALQATLLAADAVIVSRGSTGVYLEALFARMGIAERLAGRLTREANGTAVAARLAVGSGREYGLTATTELAEAHDGIDIVGPLPPEVQMATAYAAAATSDGDAKPHVAPMLALLRSPAGKAAMVAGGIE